MKQLLIILLILAGIVGGAFWYYQTRFHPVSPAEVRVLDLQGKVTGELGGVSRSLSAKDKLPAGSKISTAKDASVVVEVDDGEQLRLAGDSELAVTAVSAEGARFELRQGKIEARVTQYRNRTLSVGVPGNKVAVQTGKGAFELVADGWGSFDVAAREGDVRLVEGGAQAEQVPVGERRVVAEDGERLLAGGAPRSVLLKVEWPENRVWREKSMQVVGTVTPGSRVEVGGQLIRPGRDGTFRATVPLQEGANKIPVRATGLGEAALAESPEIVVDTRPPKLRTTTSEIWK